MNIKRTNTKEVNGQPTVTETDVFEVPDEVADLVKGLLGEGKKESPYDQVTREILAELYCDSHEYRDEQVARERARKIYRRLGLRHWSDGEEP